MFLFADSHYCHSAIDSDSGKLTTYRHSVWIFLPDLLSLCSSLLERMFFFVFPLHFNLSISTSRKMRRFLCSVTFSSVPKNGAALFTTCDCLQPISFLSQYSTKVGASFYCHNRHYNFSSYRVQRTVR